MNCVCTRAHTHTYIYTFSFLLMNFSSDSNQLDTANSLGKNRVRSMVNQFNAAVSTSSSPKRIPIPSTSTINTRRPGPTDTTTRTSITSTSRPSLQRAMTMNNQSPITPSPPSTPPTMNNNNNASNNSSTYKRKYAFVNIDFRVRYFLSFFASFHLQSSIDSIDFQCQRRSSSMVSSTSCWLSCKFIDILLSHDLLETFAFRMSL